MKTLRIPTAVHGRVLVQEVDEGAADSFAGLLVAFHGYGQRAEDIVEDVKQIPGVERWRIVAVQALHPFYTRDNSKVVGSWMTREDRELAIADNVAYVDKAVAQSLKGDGAAFRQSSPVPFTPHAVSPKPQASSPKPQLIFLGFSQGAAMAYRAAVLGKHRAAGVIALAGDIPPELHAVPAVAWPRVLIGAGTRDPWFDAAKLDTDVAFLSSRGIPHDVIRFDGAHEWTGEFRIAAGRWLDEIWSRGTHSH